MRVFHFERLHLYAKDSACEFLHVLDGVGLVLLNADDGAADTEGFHHDLDTNHDFLAVLEHQLVVVGEVGFALYTVDNQYFGFLARGRQQLHLRGEACSTQTYDTRSGNLVHYFLGFERAVALDVRRAVYLGEPLVALYINHDGGCAEARSVHDRVNLGYRTAHGRAYI